MRIDEIEQRLGAIRTLLDSPDYDDAQTDALTEEVRSLTAERDAIAANAAKRQALRNAVPASVVRKLEKQESRGGAAMDEKEIRSSAGYNAAFIRGLLQGDDKECRSLLTTAVSGGSVPVPTQLESEIRTAWEESTLLSLVKHSYFAGNTAVGFEVSASGAAIHVEGTDEPDEETISLGVVELKPQNIKKWITVSDEALENTTVETAAYIYRELAHRITAKAEAVLIGKITGSPAAATTAACGVPVCTAATVAADTVVKAVSLLCGEARDLHLVMNRASYPAFVAVALGANYAIDVFDGLKDRIVFTDALPAFSSATTGNAYAIVGDFGGAQANFPKGDTVQIKVDELSLAEKDLVKFVGKQPVALGVVADKHFAKICK